MNNVFQVLNYHRPLSRSEQLVEPDVFNHAPQCFDDSRDSENDSIFGARHEMQSPHSAMHRVAWTHRKAKAIGLKCEKPKQPREWKVVSRAVLRTGQEPNF